MPDNIKVRPAGEGKPVPVRTDVDGAGVHTPIYITAYGADDELTIVDEDNPLPTTGNTDEQLHSFSRQDELLVEIVMQLKILNKYMSVGHDEEFTESDLEE